MSEAQLSILNYALLALLYLFFGRVLWAVWAEVRGPRAGRAPAMARTGNAPGDPTVATDPTEARGAEPVTSVHEELQGSPARAGPGEPRLVSTIKLMQAGFHEVMDTEAMFTKWFRLFREKRLLPPA